MSRGVIVGNNFITEDIIIIINIIIHSLMEPHHLKICIAQESAPELLNAVADPGVPRSGSHKQKTTTFKQKYALECTIRSFKLLPTPLEQITGWLCQLWCVKIINMGAPPFVNS